MSAARLDADKVRLKRVYDSPAPGDGVRVLVDRLWPRGLSKAKAGGTVNPRKPTGSSDTPAGAS